MPSIRAVDGFFARASGSTVSSSNNSSDNAGDEVAVAPRLFKNFALATEGWAELGEQVATARALGRDLKVVYVVRHAEGFHNAAENEFGKAHWEAVLKFQDKYTDADLTPFGVQDATSKGPPALAAERANGMPLIERVVVSPLSRAIQTADAFFDAEYPLPSPFVCMELCREVLGVYTCDRRLSLTALKAKFPHVDFAAAGEGGVVDEVDALWSAPYRETDAELRDRARRFLVQLFESAPEQYVAVVAHSNFLRCLFDVVRPDEVASIMANCEVVPLVLERIE